MVAILAKIGLISKEFNLLYALSSQKTQINAIVTVLIRLKNGLYKHNSTKLVRVPKVEKKIDSAFPKLNSLKQTFRMKHFLLPKLSVKISNLFFRVPKEALFWVI